MSRPADFYVNRRGAVLVLAPSRDGRLAHLAETRRVVLDREGEAVNAICRWIFADLPRHSLRDEWGNAYDHQAHTLLAGSLADGEELVGALLEQGFTVVDSPDFFVPFQTLAFTDAEDSDLLRARHPRAFALARRERPTTGQLVTWIRDTIVVGER
jgi:hypothetical protein